ncbi:TraB/GumN family protein [Psychrosphaera aquimarina]|uniref:TraB/GumN family protein n=1 Tax=Psychrosphaera aquimarina TaxID=2044854 RepID=A0ABU3QYM3_9GAMM|nr:TraB/GumN family protein [Psychrosphaera aquimarina]MDU0112317.1 TraB/GumN family protein [Psychrosphaera aquimarina]
MKTYQRIRVTAVLLLGLILNVNAEPLWSNKQSGGDDWLLGTIHLGDDSLSTLPSSIKMAIDSVDIVIIETDLSRVSPSDQQRILMQYASLPAEVTLKQTLSEPVYKQAQQYFANYGVNIEQFSHFKPWLVALSMVQMSYAKLGLNAENGIDNQVQKYALQQGKKVVGLETYHQQINFFNQIIEQFPEVTNDDLILDTLSEIKHFSDLPQVMITAWHNGDMQVFEKIYRDTLGTSKFDAAAEQILLINRNHNWVSELEPVLNQQKVLVAVGTLHFVGDKGLPLLLKDKFELTAPNGY